jgi:branched-chain amino acid aminotransferase
MSSEAPLTFAHTPHPSPKTVVERAALLADPGFGRVFSDHMATIRYTEDRGWHDARFEPRQPIALDPAAAVFHYAQEIFEGLKAYKTASGEVVMFRPQANAERFQASAERLAMPPLPTELFIAALEGLIRIDRDWVPEGEGSSLYLRPFQIATEPFLGVRPSREYLFVLLASPVGAYFKGGVSAISVWLSEDFTRAAPGGTGFAKCGGNYAASLEAQAQATAQGCDQVLFLDAPERRWIEELGGMNVFLVFDDGSLQTPPLNGSILPGVTRSSILNLAKAQGVEVREEPYSIDQLRADAASGRLREVFACGTAAVLTPVGRLKTASGDMVIGNGETGLTTARFREALVDIQHGRAPDPNGWVHTVALD